MYHLTRQYKRYNRSLDFLRIFFLKKSSPFLFYKIQNVNAGFKCTSGINPIGGITELSRPRFSKILVLV